MSILRYEEEMRDLDEVVAICGLDGLPFFAIEARSAGWRGGALHSRRTPCRSSPYRSYEKDPLRAAHPSRSTKRQG